MDLQEEAKRRYPIGTIFISPYSGGKFTVTGHYDNNSIINVQVKSKGDKIPYVYWENKWAEIISAPYVENNYEIY